jgi:lipoprotein NlpD
MAARLIVITLVLLLVACYRTEPPSVYRSSASKYLTYAVKKGDTLYSIGKRFGVNHRLLARRNHIHYPYTIYIGQQLYLTRTAPRPAYMPLPKPRPDARKQMAKKQPGKRAPIASGSPSVKLRWPVSGKVMSRFGRRGSRMHDGIDINGKEGAPIYAAAAGEVVYSDQRLTGYGKLVIIRHTRDLFTAYAHNQRNLVRKGDKVRAGDLIARVGRTGRTSGAHLHFEVRRGATPVNPLAYLPRK